jgi:hypothetical protein
VSAASAVRRLRDSSVLRSTARVGLVGRGVFYLLLAALAVSLLVGPPGSQTPANANGALRSVAQTALGRLLLVGAAVGFAAFGLARLIGAATDGGQGGLRRLSTAGQGVGYLVMAWLTGSFLLGQQGTGSEQQRERTTGVILGLPGGRLLVAAVGVAVLGVCCWQLTVAARGHFGDTLNSEQMSPTVRRTVWLTARVGITARALAYIPLGGFLVLAGARSAPEQADGLDAVLLELTRTPWGSAVVAAVAAGFAVFAAYSFLEARYRQVLAGA